MKRIARLRRFPVFVLFFWLVAACLLPAGCDKTEGPQVTVPDCSGNGSNSSGDSDREATVGFNTSVDRPGTGMEADIPGTRAGVITSANIASMGVFASFTGTDAWTETTATPNFMYNQQVTRDATVGTWTYTPLKYWPSRQGEQVSFFAYAPHMAADAPDSPVTFSANTAVGYPTLIYTVPATAAAQQDLLIAPPVLDRTKTTDAIHFRLSHVLTKVTIRVKCVDAITVNTVQLTGLPQSGTLSFDATAEGFHWSDITGTATYTANSDKSVPANDPVATEVCTFFLLPQRPSGVRLRITYTKDGIRKTTDLPFPDGAPEWTAGVPVTYTTRIGGKPATASVGDLLCVDPADGSIYMMKPDETFTEVHRQRAAAVVFYMGTGSGDAPGYYEGKLSRITGYALAVWEPGGGGYAYTWAVMEGSATATKLSGTSLNAYDFKGYYNTKMLRQAAVGGDFKMSFRVAYAATVETEAVFPAPAATSGWYLLSAGQGRVLQSQLNILEASFKLAMGKKYHIMSGRPLWTSTEINTVDGKGVYYAYSLSVESSDLQVEAKTEFNFVRSVLTF